MGADEGQTLGRLSIRIAVSAEEFADEYEKRLAPVLEDRGLVAVDEEPPVPVDGFFCRLFALERPEESDARERVLKADPVWQKELEGLREMTAPGERGEVFTLLPFRFPARPVQVADVGPGFYKEQWHSFGTEDGLPGAIIECLVEDGEGNLWFGCREQGGLCRFDGARVETFCAREGEEWKQIPGGCHLKEEDSVHALLEDRKGRLWIGANLLHCYDGERLVSFPPGRDGMLGYTVKVLHEDQAGGLWAGTRTGLSRYDGEGFIHFTTQEGLAHNPVNALCEDPVGDLWVGTQGGLSRYDGRQLAHLTLREGLPDSWLMWLAEGKDWSLWIGTLRGACRLRNGQPEPVPELDGQMVMQVLADRQGRVWFGTWQGMFCFDGHAWRQFTVADGLGGNRVDQIVEDSDGTIWCKSSMSGVYVARYDGQRFRLFPLKEGEVQTLVPRMLADRQGRMWFGTPDGMYRYDGRETVCLTAEDELWGSGLLPLLEDREGDLWFSSTQGMYRYDGRTFHHLPIGEGVAERILVMLEDRDCHLWFGSKKGVVRTDGTAVQRLGRREGLPHDLVVHLLQTRDGEIWIATETGLTRYRSRQRPPEVRIEDVVGDQHYGAADEVEVPVAEKLLIFRFTGRSWTTHPDSMSYVCRLEGRDDGWQAVLEGRAEYQGPEIGEYVFQVRAVDRDLNYSSPAEVRVRVVADPKVEGLARALSGGNEEFIGDSPAVEKVRAELEAVAAMDMSVLILGETGTGKGLAARLVHGYSARQGGPLIQVNCGSLPEGLVESELFGHEKGAFTGAVARKLGRAELASGGTLFLDEIGDLSLGSQAKLLQLLEECPFTRLGGTQVLNLEARVIAATNRDLEAMVREGAFREDLYYRLRVYPVQLPPLRERREDMELLALFFLERMAAHLHKEASQLSDACLALLQAYDWPGNVRELEHAVQRAVIVCRGEVLESEHIILGAGIPAAEQPVLTPEEYERWYFERALEACGWVIKGEDGAAAKLGMAPSSLRNRMKRLGIERP